MSVISLLLLLIQLTLFSIAGLAAISGMASSLPMFLATCSLALLAAAVGLSWLSFGRQTLPLAIALRIPFYVLWKLGLYVSLLVKGRQKTWERTEREPPGQVTKDP